MIQAGKLRIIALFSEKRFDMFPNVPTVKEQGVNFTMGMWRGPGRAEGDAARGDPEAPRRLQEGNG